MRRLILVLPAIAVACFVAGSLQAAHSSYGCHNCHVPHKAGVEGDADASWGVPLWSTAQTKDGLPTYTLYSSKTFDALGTDIGQPDGASKLCLSCHDGSFDFIVESPRHFQPGDLAKSHPISFTYDSALAAKVPNGTLKDPSVALSGLGGTVAQDLLDVKNKLQCTSCHDIHIQGKGDHLLRFDFNYTTSPKNDHLMCRTCHNK